MLLQPLAIMQQHDSKQVLDGLLALQRPLIAQSVPRAGDDMDKMGLLLLENDDEKRQGQSLAETYQQCGVVGSTTPP